MHHAFTVFYIDLVIDTLTVQSEVAFNTKKKWPLERGSIHMKFSTTGQEKATFKYRWLLNRGNSMGRFDL